MFSQEFESIHINARSDIGRDPTSIDLVVDMRIPPAKAISPSTARAVNE
jgi:hypothetical protein